ncbi:hypothetical protein [Micromonospora sp. b486]|nr:hypothetical protein [Micromonospora sp. b486]MDM4784542.1 hypothetical protein [Micromonospora sp. b486]
MNTEDVVLPPAYWNADATVATLRVTVTNTAGGRSGSAWATRCRPA